MSFRTQLSGRRHRNFYLTMKTIEHLLESRFIDWPINYHIVMDMVFMFLDFVREEVQEMDRILKLLDNQTMVVNSTLCNDSQSSVRMKIGQVQGKSNCNQNPTLLSELGLGWVRVQTNCCWPQTWAQTHENRCVQAMSGKIENFKQVIKLYVYIDILSKW